jgi:hypothetical protein
MLSLKCLFKPFQTNSSSLALVPMSFYQRDFSPIATPVNTHTITAKKMHG